MYSESLTHWSRVWSLEPFSFLLKVIQGACATTRACSGLSCTPWISLVAPEWMGLGSRAEGWVGGQGRQGTLPGDTGTPGTLQRDQREKSIFNPPNKGDQGGVLSSFRAQLQRCTDAISNAVLLFGMRIFFVRPLQKIWLINDLR